MGIARNFGKLAVAIACVSMLASPVLAVPESTRPAIADVAIQPDGSLHGLVVNTNGISQNGEAVTVVSRGAVVARVQTDDRGQFRVENMRGGVYQVQTAGALVVCRVWSHRTAPPAAAQQLLIAQQGAVVRGQHAANIMNALGNPLLLSGMVAMAVAVPLALDDSNDSD